MGGAVAGSVPVVVVCTGVVVELVRGAAPVAEGSAGLLKDVSSEVKPVESTGGVLKLEYSAGFCLVEEALCT